MSQVNKKLILVSGLAAIAVVLAIAGQVESCRPERRLERARTTIANLLRMYPELANEANNGGNQSNQGQNQFIPNQNGQQQQQMPNNQNNQSPNQVPQNQQNVIPSTNNNNGQQPLNNQNQQNATPNNNAQPLSS